MAQKNTVTLRALAESLNLSTATVSLVLNNRGNSSRISLETQKKVFDKAREMGYISAKTDIPISAKTKPIIPTFCLLWPVENLYNSYIGDDSAIERIAKSLMHHQSSIDFKFNSVFQTYLSGHIEDSSEFISRNYYDGVILAGLCDDDLHYIEHQQWDIPIVLYNRVSNYFASVITDEYETGCIVANHFLARGHSIFAVVAPTIVSQNYSFKHSGFINTLLKNGIPQKNIISVKVSNDSSGGYQAMEKIFQFESTPTAVFCIDDRSVTGIYKYASQHHIQIPQDIEIVTSGDHSWNSYLSPSVTSIKPPVDECMSDCISILIQSITTTDPANITLLSHSRYSHPVHLNYRESSPKPETDSGLHRLSVKSQKQ